jgi:hypothetical protein
MGRRGPEDHVPVLGRPGIVATADADVDAFPEVVSHGRDFGGEGVTHVANVIVERTGDRWLVDEVIEFGDSEDVEE